MNTNKNMQRIEAEIQDFLSKKFGELYEETGLRVRETELFHTFYYPNETAPVVILTLS